MSQKLKSDKTCSTVSRSITHTCLWLVTNSSITHLDWVAFLWCRTTVPLVFLHGCSVLPIGRQYFHPQFGLATISVCLITASFQQLHNASSNHKLPFRAAQCHAMYPYLSLARNNFFFKSFGLSCVSSAQTESFWMFLYGCSVLPFGRQYIHPQFGLTTIHLFLFPLPQPTTTVTVMPPNCLLLLFGATQWGNHNCLWLEIIFTPSFWIYLCFFSPCPQSVKCFYKVFVAARCKAVNPFPVSASNNFSVFISTSLEQIHNTSNVSILPASAAMCHAICPFLSVDSKNFFNSFGLICVSSAQIHSLFSASIWLFCPASWSALDTSPIWVRNISSVFNLVHLP